MSKGYLRRAGGLWIGLLASAIIAGVMLAGAPRANAQSFSDSYNFLKAVKDGDGSKATEIATRPGSTVVNTREPGSGEGALHIVVKRRDLPWTGFMLKNGANPNLRDNDGNTPLIDATRIGWDEGVSVLLAVGAGVNTANSRGETPLIVAVQLRNQALVRQLLGAGADPRQTDHVAGLSALDYATRDPRAAILLKMLTDAPPVKHAPVMGPTR